MNQELIYYLQKQTLTLTDRLRRFTHSIEGIEYPKRLMFTTIEHYIQDFLDKKANNKMVIMPGFRGVGKTTLMAQLLATYRGRVKHCLFLSIEDSKNLFDAGITDLIAAYEAILGCNLESVKEPVLVFLDEIQADPTWAITLKSLFERTTNLFFCCTGSSTVILQATTNLARRAVFEKVPPMSFTEYEMTKHGIDPPIDSQKELRSAIYFSKDAAEAYHHLEGLGAKVNQYWSQINRADIQTYLAYGSLPFAFTLPNETAVYDAISLLLDKMITSDLAALGNFDQHTLGMVKRILFAIAENDVTSFAKLEEKFHLSRHTIASIFDALEKAELLIKIPAYGSNMTIAKKSSKYLFMSPAIRMSFFYITGIEATYLVRQGKLLEDAIGAHLYREFIIKGQGSLRYDSQVGGADFILQILNHQQLIIEVGVGEKSAKQIYQTAKKVDSAYNLIFSSTGLKQDKEQKTVFVPLDYWFLL